MLVSIVSGVLERSGIAVGGLESKLGSVTVTL